MVISRVEKIHQIRHLANDLVLSTVHNLMGFTSDVSGFCAESMVLRG